MEPRALDSFVGVRNQIKFVVCAQSDKKETANRLKLNKLAPSLGLLLTLDGSF